MDGPVRREAPAAARRALATVLSVAALAFPGRPAAAQTAPDGPSGPGGPAPRVVGAVAAQLLLDELGRAGLDLRVFRTERDAIAVRACLGPCLEARLTDASAGCDGVAAGAFCIHPGPDAPAAVLGALQAALTLQPDPWTAVEAQRNDPIGRVDWPADAAPPEAEAPAPAEDDELAFALAAALVVVPLLAGWAAGRLGRRALRRPVSSRWVRAAVVAVPLLVAVVLPFDVLRVGLWDRIQVAALLGAAAVAGLRPGLDVRSVALGIAATVLGLALVEGGARWLLPMPPACPRPGAARLLLPPWGALPRGGPASWAALYPDPFPGFLEDADGAQGIGPRVAGPGGPPRVLHLGDSLAEGREVRPAERVTGQLAALLPGTTHVNAAVGGTGPDFYLLVLDTWADRLHPDLVVVHVYPGNDTGDMDAPYADCDAGPLLDFAPGGPVRRCPQPRWAISHRLPLLASPAPYAVRVAASVSYAARHVTAALHPVGGEEVMVGDVRWQHFLASLLAIRDHAAARHIPVIFSLMPERAVVEDRAAGRPVPGETVLRDAIRAVGIEVLEPSIALQAAVARDGPSCCFNDRPAGDVHMNAGGHRVVAEFLRGPVAAALGITPAS